MISEAPGAKLANPLAMYPLAGVNFYGQTSVRVPLRVSLMSIIVIAEAK